MFGRLVSDDGTAENCAFGSPHGNRVDCTAPNRLVFCKVGDNIGNFGISTILLFQSGKDCLSCM